MEIDGFDFRGFIAFENCSQLILMQESRRSYQAFYEFGTICSNHCVSFVIQMRGSRDGGGFGGFEGK